MTSRNRTSIVAVAALVLAGTRVVLAEDLRTDGTRVFEERMTRLGEVAREHDDVEAHIQESCLANVVVNTQSGAVTGVLSPVCQELRNQADRLEAVLRDGVTRAKEDARRAGIYPGTVRGSLRRERLEAFSE
jgi:hypothetical protein